MKAHGFRPRCLPLALTLLLAGIAVAGCTRPAQDIPKPPASSKSETPAPAPEPAEKTEQVLLYFVRGEKIGVAGRLVPQTGSTAEKAQAAIRELVAGPSAGDKGYGLASAIPTGTTVLGLEIQTGVAGVNLSKQFESGGGSLSMLLRVAQVVCTLTQFADIDHVAFAIEGKPVKAIGGEGVVVDPPVGRADFEEQLPPILVEKPVPGELVTSPLTVEGSANVFEAQFNAKVSDGMGDTLVDAAVKASAGTGTRGTFEQQLEFTSLGGGVGSVTVYDRSEKDGSVTDEVKIPIRFK